MLRSILYFILVLLIYPSKVSYAQNIQALEDSTSQDSTKISEKEIMEDIREFASKDNILSQVVEMLLVSKSEEANINPNTYSDHSYENNSGKTIRNIKVYVMDVFGPSINDPLDSAKSWVEKTGNALHIKSQKWLIKNQLLFKENHKLLPFRLSESERLLRSRDYVTDARIKVVPTEYQDSVDVSVIVEDVWSIEAIGNYDFNSHSWQLGLEDQNFVGSGADVKVALIKDDVADYDWEGAFTAENFLGKNIRGSVFKEITNLDQYYGFAITREFFSPVIHWAGGINMTRENIYRYYLINDSSRLMNSTFNRNEIWLGYATDFKKLTQRDKLQNEYIVAGSIQQLSYIKREEEFSHNLFYDRKLYLGSFGYSFRRYYKDRYVLALGRTEDIPTGTIISLIGGFEKGEFVDRRYFGLQTGYSTFNQDRGYFFAGLAAGAFRLQDQWEDGVIAANVLYFTPLSEIRNLRVRHFIFSRFAYVTDPLRHQEMLRINRDSGIRGFRADNTMGNKKMVFNYEINLYPPYQLLGFNMAFVGFADFAFLAQQHQTMLKSDFFHGYGIGFRFRNDNLIFRSIQILFGFYPNGNHVGSSQFSIFEQERDYYQFNDFRYPKPDVIRY